MKARRTNTYLWFGCVLAWLAASTLAFASEYRGQILFGDSPVPGATITASRADKSITVTSNQQGLFLFPDLADGTWTIDVEMLCFAPAKQDVAIAPSLPIARWELKLLPLDQIIAKVNEIPKPAPKPALTARPATAKASNDAPLPDLPKPSDDSPRPADGLLINGSVNNAATSQYTLAPAFGNSRSSKSLYTFGVSFVLDNSALDARPFSLTGVQTAKPSYNDMTGGLSFGGPLNIPHLMPRGPNLFLSYQWTRNRSDNTLFGLVPTAAQTLVPPGDPVAAYLLTFYKPPNVVGSSYNYQVSAPSNTHQDAFSIRLDRRIARRDSLSGGFALQSTRSDSMNLFKFVDTTDLLGMNTNPTWTHSFGHQIFNTAGYRFSRLRTHVIPQFENRTNVSGNAGITAATQPILASSGNDQDPADWGPPTLVFSGGISTLTDGNSANNRNESNSVSDSVTYSHHRHNYTLGADLRRQEFNYFSQQNPRGTFTFTSIPNTASTDFANFAAGIPQTSSIAFGNADKYLRQSVYDVYFTDDWRLRPEFTVNIGIRWDYGAPVTEVKGRLVNLDVAPGFSAVSPVKASTPVGALTGQQYPTSLIRPDKRGFEPRIGISWRPIAASTLVIRAGYGIYDDTSVYQSPASMMAQQAPISKSVSESNTCGLTLENGFTACASSTQQNFAIDPNFRVGYAQDWNISAQRDLPWALVGTVTYTGIKGTRGVQEYLPNSYPIGGTSPCLTTCQSGFIYRGSNGNSTREAGQVQLRRRLRSGLTATAQYIYSKSIDDDAMLGGQGPVAAGAASQAQASAIIAQNWLNLSGERGLSSFDQRHLFSGSVQYTSGMGKAGGTLMSGWRGTLLKEWTVLSSITAGSGLPETPVYLATTPGTGFIGTTRPSLSGAPIYAASSGHHLNAAAYTAPLSGQWGTAGRNSITGPDQFSFNGSVQRTFRLKDHLNLDVRFDATNLLNHVVYSSWNTALAPCPASCQGSTLQNPLFGAPSSANAMRSMQTTVRLRY